MSNSKEHIDLSPLDDKSPIHTPGEIGLEDSSPSLHLRTNAFSPEKHQKDESRRIAYSCITEHSYRSFSNTSLVRRCTNPMGPESKNVYKLQTISADSRVTDSRTISTSLRCRLGGNTGTTFTRIIAIPDGPSSSSQHKIQPVLPSKMVPPSRRLGLRTTDPNHV
jgi:hypothetical protein